MLYWASHVLVDWGFCGLGFLVFHCLPDYAWAVGNMAEAARQLDKLVEHRPRSQVYEDMGRHVHCRIISGIGKVACGHLNLIKCIYLSGEARVIGREEPPAANCHQEAEQYWNVQRE